MKLKPVIDVTVSGSLKSGYRLPNGDMDYFTGKSGICFAWSGCEPYTFKFNVLAAERFQRQTYPVVDVTVKEKDVSKFKKFWYADCPGKIYNIDVKTVGEKTVTMVKTVSGSVYYFDEDISVFEDALNSADKE